MAFVGDAVRFVTATVDARLVAPVTTRLANSVANPYVLSFLLWDRIKKLTPQRARDLTRLLSAAVANGVGVLGAPEAARLAGSARRLQDELVAATVTPQGKNIILNGVATASKVAQALHTPETQVATRQLFETLQSLVDFFASAPGRKVIATAGECVVGVCDVLASPEAAVLLAEVATNLCHALEVEALRRDAEADAAMAATAKEQEEEDQEEQTMTFRAEEDKPSGMGSRASVSSADDTALEDDATFSEFSFPPSRTTTPATHQYASASLPNDLHEIPATATEPAARQAKERSALRSARIEKDVLLKMGVNPSMLEEVQRILDRLREEQAREEAAASAQVIPEETEDAFATDQEEDDSEISSAFGIRSSSLPLDPEPPLVDEETKTEEEDDGGVILPEWHPEPVRAALRRRHVADSERAAQRTTFEDQSREMAVLLARRRVVHGDLAPADVLACRVISQLIIGAFAVLLLLLFVALCRRVLA